MDFNKYLELLTRFRATHKLPAPTEAEIAEWQTEWNSWNKKRREREVENVNTHLIISSSARG